MTLIAGIRFSDGGLLLAISKGEDAASPAFRDPLTQYHWDQPLKVTLLKVLPPRILVIALVFLGLTLLPVAFAWSSNVDVRWLAFTALFLTPALKVVLQNIGAGDGLIIALIIIAASYPTKFVLLCCFFTIGIWHPHQSFFVGLSALLAIYLYDDHPDLAKYFSILGALAAALVVYLVYKVNLTFEFTGRSGFIASHLGNFITRNLLYAPVALAPIIIWFAFAAPRPGRGENILTVWLLVLCLASLIATDVTRVMTIISLPIVLGGADNLQRRDPDEPIPKKRMIYLALMMALVPVYSWSGLDYILWKDLIADFYKWGIL